MTLRRFCTAGLVLLAGGLLTGCYYPAAPSYAYYPPCTPGAAPTYNADGTAVPATNCYVYYPPPYAYDPYYPYYPSYYYPPYYYPPVAVGVGVGFGFRGRFH